MVNVSVRGTYLSYCAGGGVGPDIRAVCFLRARSEHLYRCFIGANDLLPEHYVAQRIDQRLQLDASNAIEPTLNVESLSQLDQRSIPDGKNRNVPIKLDRPNILVSRTRNLLEFTF